MSSLLLTLPAGQALRVLQGVLMATAAACGALAEALQRRRERLEQACRACDAQRLALQLPPALLRDIGAPDWLEAAAERELARERLRLEIDRIARR